MPSSGPGELTANVSRVACHARCIIPMVSRSFTSQRARQARSYAGPLFSRELRIEAESQPHWAAFALLPNLARHARCSVSRYVATSTGRAGLSKMHPLPLGAE